MRCACCGRSINPANAVTKLYKWQYADGTVYTKVGTYGPVCGQRLGFTQSAPKRKPSRFALHGPRAPVKVDEGQVDLFAVIA